MKITYVDNLNNTPARVNRETGEIQLDRKMWFSLPEPYRKFILEHEKGHYYLQTTNELLADQYAFEQVAGTFNGSLLEMVKTLADVLPFHSETHQARLLNLYKLALEWDKKHDPQPNTDAALEQVKQQLSAFTNNPQYFDYMELVFSQQRKGRPGDYEYPGYTNSSLYKPSVGRYFHDVPMQTEFEKRYTPQAQTNDPIPNATQEDMAQNETVSLDLVPDMSKGIQIDIPTLFIILLIVLIVLGISKL